VVSTANPASGGVHPVCPRMIVESVRPEHAVSRLAVGVADNFSGVNCLQRVILTGFGV
jgi:hypothetical protein